MKKLLVIIVLSLLWSGNANANILLKDCRYIFEDGSLSELDIEDGARYEYYINFEEGYVLHTSVSSEEDFEFFRRIGEISKDDDTPILQRVERSRNLKFMITFADEKQISAKTKANAKGVFEGTFKELYIDLDKSIIKLSYTPVNSFGEKVLARANKIIKDGFLEKRDTLQCEQENTNNQTAPSSGTAFFISNKGYLLTNNHVVEGCKAQKINYFNKEYDAQIIATDKNLDLALLKVDTKNNNYINFSKSEIEKLQKVYVAGYPFGKGLSDDLKVSSGIISSNKGFEDNSNEFQIDAPINPGNSGGPIVNDTGELVGIAVAGFAKDKSEGINFGIKSSTARTFLNTNKVKPGNSYMTFAMNNKKLLNLLEESTVYTFCD